MSVFSTGLFGMGLTIIFLLTFQSFYGYIYYWIGLIISAFMLGLSGGGLWGSKDVSKNRDSTSLFFYLEETITLYLLLIIVCIFYIQFLLKIELLYFLFPFIILFLTFICGALVGLQFPHANKLYLNKPGRFTQTAGAIYATDLLGAWAGGILLTLILIPIIGTIETVIVLFIMKLATTINFKQSQK
jgi:spermidine synthase